MIDKNLGQDIKNPVERLQFLKNNCRGIEEKGYMQQFSPEEMAGMKDTLAECSISINTIEIEKKDVVDTFKERLKPLELDRKQLLENIQKKAQYVTEETYKFLFEEDRMVGFYNKDGVLIDARPMNADDGQLNMFMPSVDFAERSGTND